MDEQIARQTREEIDRLLKNRQSADAIPLIRQLAHWSDVEMQKLAADIYLKGLYNTPVNPYAAFDYVKLAAMNGETEYMVTLGLMFQNGSGTSKDAQKAFYFLNKAAELNEPKAYDPLALMYLKGIGTQKNPAEAKKWIDQAVSAFPDDETIHRHQFLIKKTLSKSS